VGNVENFSPENINSRKKWNKMKCPRCGAEMKFEKETERWICLKCNYEMDGDYWEDDAL